MLWFSTGELPRWLPMTLVKFRKSTKHFWTFTVKQRCSIRLHNWCCWGLVSKRKNQLEKNIKMAPHSWSDAIQVSWSPEIPNWFEKMLFTIFTVAAEQKVSCTPSDCRDCLVKSVWALWVFLKCFVDNRTWPDVPSAWGWRVNDWIFVPNVSGKDFSLSRLPSQSVIIWQVGTSLLACEREREDGSSWGNVLICGFICDICDRTRAQALIITI